MRILTIHACLLIFVSSGAFAAKPMPSDCACDFSAVLTSPNTPSCIEFDTLEQILRRSHGSYLESLDFVSGYGEDCTSLEVFKVAAGNNTTFECIVMSGTSGEAGAGPVCEMEGAPHRLSISRSNARNCQLLMDEVYEALAALPACG